MKSNSVVQNIFIKKNTAEAFVVRKDQRFRVYGMSTADMTIFNADNLKERFDQARTKTNQGKIFISKGDRLISKFNNTMLTILEDKFKEQGGTHDLQKGFCSKRVYQEDLTFAYHGSKLRAFRAPEHGCWENLSDALSKWGIRPEDIPSPLNIFQAVEIDGRTGTMRETSIRPKQGTYVEFLANMNCLIAISACPESGNPIAENGITVQVLDD